MHIAILTFEGYNELDSLIALGVLNRVKGDGWRVTIAAPTARVTSMNGVVIEQMSTLEEARGADAVIVGSGTATREVVQDRAIMEILRQLDPSRQLIAAQCSGALVLARLGLLDGIPACTDLTTRPWVAAAGVEVLNQPFFARDNIATAGGCLASHYLAAWLITRLRGREAAEGALHYVAPVGEKQEYIARAWRNITPYLPDALAGQPGGHPGVVLRSEAEASAPDQDGQGHMSDGGQVGQAPGGPDGTGAPDPRRWLVLGVIALAQLMIVLDATIMNIALPSAQRSLHFTIVDRQWVVTAYALAFGSLLLLGGKLSDLLGRKVTFLAGLIGFAAASAVGGAALNFGMLVAARACQGAFGALLAPAALSLLAVTFSDPAERGRAFGVYGAVAGAGGAVGLLLGGVLTEYLSWRWCLYVNLFFAGLAAAGAAVLLPRHPALGRPKMDLPGAALVSAGMFCIVYGFSNAALHSWHTPSTWGFLAAGVVLLVLFGFRQARAPQPLLPPRVVTDRNRGGAYLTMLIASAGMFGIFLFLTYYLQQTLGFSPVVTGLAFLPMVAGIMTASISSNIVLMPRFGPRPLAPTGMILAAGGLALLTRIGVHSGYAGAVLPSLLMMGLGLGLVFAPVFNTGTFGVPPQDAGVAAATVNTGQQLGGSIGTSLLNTIFASSVASYIAARSGRGRPGAQLAGQALIHGYSTVFWWSAAILTGGAIVAVTLFRSGPLTRPGQPQQFQPGPDAAPVPDAGRPQA